MTDETRVVLYLQRFAYSPMGTFGELQFDDSRIYTVEQPWNNNTPFVSCIPEGVYELQWFNSPRFGRTLALTGETVSLQEDPNFKRYLILIHAANTMDDVKGCIGLGDSFGFVKSKWAVLNSALTTKAFLSKIPDPFPENTRYFLDIRAKNIYY